SARRPPRRSRARSAQAKARRTRKLGERRIEGETTMRSMRSAALLALTSTLVIVAAPGTARGEDTEQSIYAAARSEGKVVIWTPLDMDLYRRIALSFAQRYPGVAIEPFRIQPGPAVERLVTEAKAGRINVDAIDPNIAYFPILIE